MDLKITGLTADTSPTSDDLIPTVNDPAGTPANRKVTLGNAITKAHGLSDSTVVGVSGGVLTSGTDVAVVDGGTGASNAAGARTNLGLVIGTDVQAYDADLATLATAFTSASATGAAKLAFHEDTDNGTNKVEVQGPASVASDKVLTLPDATDTLVGKDTTDTFTNKTINLSSNTLTATKAQLDTAVSDGNIMFDGDSITNATATAHRVFYSDGSGVITELALGADGTFLKSNGATAAPSFATPAGSGDVSKVGTPANNQVGVWTGDGTLEGDTALTFDTTTDTLSVAASGKIAMGAVNIIDDSAGTTTLSNIDALDATTEATIETAIDTLANLTSIQGRTVTLADAGANAIFGWDDVAGAYENLTQAEVKAVVGTASDTATGVVELATAAETTTGTDATRAVTPDGLAGSEFGKRTIGIQISGSASGDSALTTGDGKAVCAIDTAISGMNLIAVKGYVTTVSSSGTPTFQVRRSRRSSATARTEVDMLSTALTIDANEFESADAATAAVINASNDDVQTGDLLFIDCDTAGTGTKGATVLLTFQLP